MTSPHIIQLIVMTLLLIFQTHCEQCDDLILFVESLQQQVTALNLTNTITTTSTTSTTSPNTTSTNTTSPTTISTQPPTSQYDMKYVVFNGMNAECNTAGNYGTACPVYSSDGVLEVVRISTGIYNIYWNDPYPNNDYIIIATSNGLGHSGAFASLGGNDDSLDDNFGVSKYFVTIELRKLNSYDGKDSDYISVVAQPAFNLNYVTFDGSDCTGTGQYGTTCTELLNKGILEVNYEGVGEYDIYFTDLFTSLDYVILTTSNVRGTDGAITNIGGNNDASDSNYGILYDRVRVETRAITDNGNRKSDYVSFVAGFPMSDDDKYADMKWVTFNGEVCNGAGVHGTTCYIFNSLGVYEVIKESNGRYKIYWSESFYDNNYVILCNSNVEGTGGDVCVLGGNNDPTDNYYGISTQFAIIETRGMSSNSNSNTDYISVLAF